MIRVKDLRKTYGDVVAVDGVSLGVPDGCRLGIVGPSGSGKTTLLRLIAGLVAPDAGSIHIDGRCASAPGRLLEPHRRGIGFVFQRPALWPHLTVAQNVRFGLGRLGRDEAARRVGRLLEAMGIEGLADRRPAALSEGQARRVAIARALAPEPAHLLMDEPLTNLDADLKGRLVRLIRSAVADSGATLIYVSHDAGEVADLAERVVRLVGGRLEAEDGG